MCLNNINFFLVERRTILMEDIMEPNFRLWRTLRGTPWEDSIGFAFDKSPVDGAHILVLEDGDVCLEFGADGSSHVLRADHRSALTMLPHVVDSVLCALRHLVSVESDHI